MRKWLCTLALTAVMGALPITGIWGRWLGKEWGGLELLQGRRIHA
ncbi:MAG: hypothetical protein V8S93_01545 [Lachnospiraceae bacterium]